ncbi:NAD(P)H-hydrate dehydratase [Chromatiaceae bacterium AAb-1]|nr:NAD(P)H-hydrate dehydratase [Chromatiaceae bacterium AAb-1]
MTPASVHDDQTPETRYQPVTADLLRSCLPARNKDAHKGLFGHVLVIGGDNGMGGAAIMAAEAALYSGAGRVSLYTRPEHIAAALSRRPEIMASASHSRELINRATVIIAGPGLGHDNWGQALLAQALTTDKPLVLDADALNYLASLPLAERKRLKRDNWILTPHPGEAARLLGRSTTTIQQDRPAALYALQQYFGGTVILKGRGTLISNGSTPVSQLTCGNPGMATGGMGDVLSGVTGALLAQGLTPYNAACCGSWLHSMAADKLAAIQGEYGLLATELLPEIRKLLFQVTS